MVLLGGRGCERGNIFCKIDNMRGVGIVFFVISVVFCRVVLCCWYEQFTDLSEANI